jgi:hypothetical protein
MLRGKDEIDWWTLKLYEWTEKCRYKIVVSFNIFLVKVFCINIMFIWRLQFQKLPEVFLNGPTPRLYTHIY